jgi:hypothetical protein
MTFLQTPIAIYSSLAFQHEMSLPELAFSALDLKLNTSSRTGIRKSIL